MLQAELALEAQKNLFTRNNAGDAATIIIKRDSDCAIEHNYFNILVIPIDSSWKGYFDLLLLFASC